MNRRGSWVVCFALVAALLAGAPGVAEQAPRVTGTLAGELVLADVNLSGTTHGSANEAQGIYVTSRPASADRLEGVPAGNVEIDAEGAVVNWSYLREREIGYNPLHPSESPLHIAMESDSDEKSFFGANITVAYEDVPLDLLGIPSKGPGGPRFDLSALPGTVTFVPADGSTWRAGARSASAESSNSWMATFLTASSNPTPGHPVLQTTSALRWTGHGDLVLYVWGANVTVDPADGEAETYRSGRWRTDVVGDEVHPHGVTAEQHSQFLRIRLVNATFTWTHQAGPAYQVAERFELETDGAVRFEATRGLLESADAVYAVEDETFEVAGRVMQSLGPKAGDDDGLASRVRAEDATIDIPPSARRDPAAGAGGPIVPTGALTDPGVVVPVVLVAAAVAGGVAAWAVRRRDRGRDDEDLPGLTPLERSELALVDGDPRRARRLARQVLDLNPNDLDAWLLVGACLVKERAFARAVEVLAPAAERLDEDPGLAYVLTLAHAHLDDAPGVLRWGAVAGEVPALRHQLRLDPAVEPYLDRLARDWASTEEDEVGVAYA